MYTGAALLTLCGAIGGKTCATMPSYIGQRMDEGRAGILLKRRRRKKPTRSYRTCPCCGRRDGVYGLALRYQRRCIDVKEL